MTDHKQKLVEMANEITPENISHGFFLICYGDENIMECVSLTDTDLSSVAAPILEAIAKLATKTRGQDDTQKNTTLAPKLWFDKGGERKH